MMSRIQRLAGNPQRTAHRLGCKTAEFSILLRNGFVNAAFRKGVGTVIGQDLVESYVDRLHEEIGQEVIVPINNHRMVLDLTDKGVSSELYLYRTREKHSCDIYRRELANIEREIDGPMHVFEVGANIGYYALEALDATNAETHVQCIEPTPETVRTLRRNIELNGYGERTTVTQRAIGPTTGTATIGITAESNLNEIFTDTVSRKQEYVSTETVQMVSLDQYMTENSLDPESVGAVRMDVEGYEVEIVNGMQKLLHDDSPLLLFLEMHPFFLTTDQTADLLDRFSDAGLEIESVAIEGSISKCGFKERRDLDYSDLLEFDHAYRVFLRR